MLPARVPGPPPQHCVDLSGTYAHPGSAGLAQICSVRNFGDEALPLPASGGFYRSDSAPHRLELVQERCERLTLKARVQYYAEPGETAGATPRDIELNLLNGRRSRVEWTADSVTLWQRFIPAGARILPLPSLEAFQLTLSLVPNGLRYHLRHVAGPRWAQKQGGEIDCVLPRVQALP